MSRGFVHLPRNEAWPLLQLGDQPSELVVSLRVTEIAVQNWFQNSAAEVCFSCERSCCCIC